jgi:hypothetical protein
MIRALLILCCLLLAACDPLDKPDQGDPERPACAGASLRQARAAADPHVWRGVVYAPATVPQAALLDRLIPAAHAMPLPGESPVAGARVVASSGAERVEAVSDAQGRYCLRADAAWGQRWTLTATLPDGTTLRGLPALPARADINAQTEAMHRALAEAMLDPSALNPAQRQNLITIADSALGLLNPAPLVPATSAEAAVSAALTALKQDGRWQSAMAKLKPGG